MSYKCNCNKKYDYIRKNPKKESKLIMGNTNKIALIKVAKMSNLMDLDSKYIQAISNINFDATKNLKLTGIKNY